MSKTHRILQHLEDKGLQTDAEMMAAFPPGSGHFSRAFRSGLIERASGNAYRITNAGRDVLREAVTTKEQAP